MIQAMYSGISGMKAFKAGLDVIGNNIANINTTAYKSGRASFKDMLSQTMSGATGPSGNRGGTNASQVGLGVTMGAVDLNMTQGSNQASGRATDLAISGNGYFILGSGEKVAYTRDGSFTLDAEFNLVASGSGSKVLGWVADFNTGTIDTTSPINADSGLKIPVGGLSVARATSDVNIAGNLNASSTGPKQSSSISLSGILNKGAATTTATLSGTLDTAAAVTDTHAVTFNVTDAGGNTKPVTVSFTKTAANSWNYAVSSAGATSGLSTGSVVFAADGTISTFTVATGGPAATANTIPLNLSWGGNGITASVDASTLSEAAGYTAATSNIDGTAPEAPDPMSFDVYDNLGNAHAATVTFAKLPAANAWSYTIACPDATAGSIPATTSFTYDATTGVSNLKSIPLSLVLATPNGSDSPISCSVDLTALKEQSSAALIQLAGNDGSAPGDPVPVKFSIYDSLGLTHELELVFKKTSDPATWDYEVICDDASASTLPTPGQITFNSLGYSNMDSIEMNLAWANPNGSEQPLHVIIDTKSISQMNGATTADLSYQDGLELGTLESFSIGSDGLVTGVFTNGSSRTLGQLALAQFNNAAGLVKMGNNSWSQSANSGNAKIGIPGEGGLGKVDSYFLEGSNVDLATEFANMIVAQRGFQASSKIITTSDEVLQELVNLKR